MSSRPVLSRFWWATIVGSHEAPQGLSPKALLAPAICAAISILLDVLQYIVAYLQNFFALRELERMGIDEFKFNPDNPYAIGRTGLFYAKQLQHC